MSEVELKKNINFKAYGKCDVTNKRSEDELRSSSSVKVNKDFVNEIFSGLMWLG